MAIRGARLRLAWLVRLAITALLTAGRIQAIGGEVAPGIELGLPRHEALAPLLTDGDATI